MARLRPVFGALVPLGIALLFTTGVLALAGAPPLEAYRNILSGSLGSWVKAAQTLTVWVPLTLAACGLLFTFRINLWNIGVEGQVVLGAVGATAILRLAEGTDSPGAWLALSMLAGAALGGLWALLAGVLRTGAGVNEIFAGLGLNFVAAGLNIWLIFGPWKRPGIASMSGTEPFSESLWLPVAEGFRVAPAAIAVAVVAVAATAFVLRATRLGLVFKAVGRNPRAAGLFGIAPGRNILLALLIGGGLAGLAGTLQVGAVYHRLIPSISSNYGYLALLVVMLSGYRAAAAPFVAFFFAALNVGSIQLPLVMKLDSSLAGVMQGALVLAALAVSGFRARRGHGREAA